MPGATQRGRGRTSAASQYFLVVFRRVTGGGPLTVLIEET